MNRIYHTWDEWECYPAGFYENNPPGKLTPEQCEQRYFELLSDIKEFKRIMFKVITEWKNSCEHYLTNENMNRIAWMGQSALCYKYKIPSKFRGWYHKLNEEQKKEADNAALEMINLWMFLNGYECITIDAVQSKTEADLY